MENVNAGANVNGVKKVDVQSMKLKMMQGYVEMAKINRNICKEDSHLEDEANDTLLDFLGN